MTNAIQIIIDSDIYIIIYEHHHINDISYNFILGYLEVSRQTGGRRSSEPLS